VEDHTVVVTIANKKNPAAANLQPQKNAKKREFFAHFDLIHSPVQA